MLKCLRVKRERGVFAAGDNELETASLPTDSVLKPLNIVRSIPEMNTLRWLQHYKYTHSVSHYVTSRELVSGPVLQDILEYSRAGGSIITQYSTRVRVCSARDS